MIITFLKTKTPLTIRVNALGFTNLLVSSDNSLNNGITNLVVNMFVIGTADEELVLKQDNKTVTCQLN